MPLKFTQTGMTSSEDPKTFNFIIFLDSVLRGISQVMLQNNSYTGLFFIIGIFYNSINFGVAALFGTVISTATAIILSVKTSHVKAGLFGFNGALVAIALLYFLQPDPLTWLYIFFASAFSTILMAASLRILGTWKLPTLTFPFVLTSLFFLLACARFGRLQTTDLLPTAGLPKVSVVEGVVNLTTLIDGLLNGVAQVFFQGNAVTGGFFLVGLFVSSRWLFVTALMGSSIGLLTAWGMGASEVSIRSGAFGFNSVLTAIALGTVFFKPSVISFIYLVFGCIATTVVFAATSTAFEPLGMPALTLPFVLVVWIFVLASSSFPKIQQPIRNPSDDN